MPLRHNDGRPVSDGILNTLSVWFDDPKKEHICEEADDDVVLVKDRRGRMIGFGRLNYLSAKQRGRDAKVPVEVQMV